MSKARTLANLISDNAELADGQISVAEVVGAAPTANPSFTGNITVSGNVDGRDIAADGTKLDGVEASADVTDATNVTAAGALMDSELTNIAAIKALNQGVATTDEVTFDNTSLNAIAKDISDTAVDVFVYDTSKDSDGGAWRKRTQHTSWYNETLNTATRGSRKEFPAVAVIVAESNQVTIYDGDDPDLPMWMVFNQAGAIGSASNIITANSSVTSLACVNGTMCFGMNDSSNPEGTFTVNFVSELSRCYRTVGSGYTGSIYTGSVSTRNSNKSYEGDYDLLAIVSQNINDVAMTVLPNAPIDSVTGLPVPTIAVATDGGVSVIKDDGTVVDLVSDTLNHETPKQVKFVGDKVFWLGQNNYDDGWSSAFTAKIPSADVALNYNTGAGSLTKYTSFEWGTASFRSTNGSDILIPIAMGSPRTTALLEAGENDELIFGGKGPDDHGTVVKVVENLADPDSGMITQIASDFATGYQVGDIKLATLSDTDDTDVTDTNLVTNGTFDSDTSGWTSSGPTLTHASGRAVITSVSGNQQIYQAITCEIGKRYVFKADLEGYFSVHLGTTTTSANDVGYIPHGNISAQTDLTLFFTATQTTHYVIIYVIGTGNVAYADNVSVTLAEDDRSVNGGFRGNGLQVFGTVTKNPVATGADLVAYSNTSTSDYLFQPYNSALDFAGDFAFTFWAKSNTTDQHTFFARQNPTTGSNSYGSTPYLFAQSNSSNTLSWYYRGTSSSGNYVSSAAIRDNNWHHFCLMRSSGTMYAYIDGKLDGSFSFSESFVNTSAPFFVGIHSYNDTFLRPLSDGGVALMRISATAPSPEQIAKIYNDEKHLFQENAQATLYGSSDAVTALAHDDSTDLLHVGTSAGRSVFQGLRRVENTTTAVGATISASNGLVAED